MPTMSASSLRIAAQREPIRTKVTAGLTRMILEGGFAPDKTVSIAAAARELGISPTPVREALVELSQQGLVDVHPGRGFAVRPLDEKEFRDLYELISATEIVALRLAGGVSEDLLRRLRRLNERLRGSRPGIEALERDAAWHDTLVGASGNDVLRDQLRQLRNRARRYEIRFMASADRVVESADQHDAIHDALQKGDLDTAEALLEANWLGQLAAALPSLSSNPPRPIRGSA